MKTQNKEIEMKKNHVSIICTLFWVLLISPLFSSTINIPGDYDTIQEGINAAQDADTVLVADGEYFENINYRGKSIVVASNFAINGDFSHITNTIINGSMSTVPDTGSCVFIGAGSDSTTVLQGFTVTGGTGTEYNFFNHGFVFREGGSIILSECSATVKNNLIVNNESVGGGGGAISTMYGNHPRILNNVIMSNSAFYASGIVLNWSGGIIRNNIIYNNNCYGDYGTAGIMVWESDPGTAIIENNTIVNNISSTTAGGLSVTNTSAFIRNNIIWGNTQTSGGQVTGSETSTFEYCNTEESYTGQGNISITPGFLTSDFLLNSQSPCIDAGDPNSSFNDKEDPDNPGFALYPSLDELRNDIGAYGGPGATLLPDFSHIVGVEEDKISLIPESIQLQQNYPNPFNPETTISFNISEPSIINLKIYNVNGQLIRTLVEGHKSAGFHTVKWNGKDALNKQIPSGIYFYQLKNESVTLTKRMILVK